MSTKPSVRRQLLAEREQAYPELQEEWKRTLLTQQSNWEYLFSIHFRLVEIERRLSRRRRPE